MLTYFSSSSFLLSLIFLVVLPVRQIICDEDSSGGSVNNKENPVPSRIGLYNEQRGEGDKEKDGEDKNKDNPQPIIFKCCDFNKEFYETSGKKEENIDFCFKIHHYDELQNSSAGKHLNTTVESSWTVPASISASKNSIDVTLKTGRPNCNHANHNRELHWISIGENDDSNNGSSHVITPEGYFGHKNTHFYPPHSYCLERVNETSIAIELCKGDCEGDPLTSSSWSSSWSSCLQKCCPLGEIVDLAGMKCTSTSKPWTPIVYQGKNGNSTVSPLSDPNWTPHILHRSPESCSGAVQSWTWPSDSENVFRALKNGDVIYKHMAINSSSNENAEDWKELTPSERFYCFDTTESIDETYPNSNEMNAVQILVFCGEKYDFPSILFASLYSTALFIASVFLLVVAVVNCLLWRKQNVHWFNWTVQAYIISLFFFYISLGVSYLLDPQDNDVGGEQYENENGTDTFYYLDKFNLCSVIGGVAHYFFLTSFCFLSMINFDLWYKFRKLTIYSTSSRGIRKFFLYLVFSMGLPAVVVTIGLVLQYFVKENPETAAASWLITPNYGKIVCYMDDDAMWPYLYGPISVLLLANLGFFISTIISLYKISKNTRIATDHMNTKRRHKQLKLFVKLFCVMGILWNFEVISYACSGSGPEKEGEEKDYHNKYPEWYWVIFDALNIFQGVAIFFIFIWKRQVKTALLVQYPVLRVLCCLPKTANTSTFVRRVDDERKFSGASTGATQEFRMSNVGQSQRGNGG